MDDQNIAIRLKGFIEAEGLSNSQFADRCGIPRPSLSQILTGRNKKISDVIVGQIHKAFPQLSVLWLMFGEGPMINKPVGEESTENLFNDFGFSDGSLFTDTTEFVDDDTQNMIRSNVNALNNPQNSAQSSQYKRVDDDSKIAELQKQIDKLRKNPRKVSHITVYYDDSTFETFIPQRN